MIAIVTDSAASLPDSLVAAHDVEIVPLQVVVGTTPYDEGSGITAEEIVEALGGRTPVSTSRPSPERMGEVYAALAERGADAIVSVHLSADLSGTYESALLAAQDSPVPVHPVDSRQVGMGIGFAVLAAARAREAGAAAAEIADAAREHAARTDSRFYVNTLDFLRRGGRMGATAALVGSALAVKPLLAVADGRIVSRERVRTAGRALTRLEEHGLEAADGHSVEVAVQHLSTPERAEALAERLTERLEGRLVGEIVVGEISAALGVHVGPGMVALTVVARD